MTEERAQFEGWAILEVMGYRKLGGYLSEQSLAGHGFIRIDVPATEHSAAMTQLYAPSSVFSVTPTTEEHARAFAHYSTPPPVQPYQLLPPATPVHRPFPTEGYEDRFENADVDEDPVTVVHGEESDDEEERDPYFSGSAVGAGAVTDPADLPFE